MISSVLSDEPALYIFAGLPGSGKTTLSQRLARHVGATYLRIDTVEQALRNLCAVEVEGEGYALSYRIAADNLRLGVGVVADSCNPIELSRRAWERVALDAGVNYFNIEVVCTDTAEHRRRIESRRSTIPGMTLPTWSDVENREYHEWTTDRIVLDTGKNTEAKCFADLLATLSRAAEVELRR